MVVPQSTSIRHAPASLAGNQLEVRARRPNHQGLQEAVLQYRGLELVQRPVFELAARLERVVFDLVNVQMQ